MSTSAANKLLNSMLIQIKQPNKHLPQYMAIVAAPEGKAIHSFGLPPNWTGENLDAILSAFRSGISRDRYATMRGKETGILTPRAFGKELFQTIFAGKVENLYRNSLSDTQNRRDNLPIRLDIEPKALARLPWEFLFDPQEATAAGYLGFNEETPIIRFFDKTPRQPTYDPPLRILLVSANANQDALLNLQKEQEAIERQLRSLKQANKARIEFLPAATIDGLAKLIREFKPHIVHFMGHGNVDRLILENGAGLSSEALTINLRNDRSLRLVVLNACEAGGVAASSSSAEARISVARSLAQSGIPAVVAMQFAISDGAAIAFAERFYQVLVEGGSVSKAMTWSRIAMQNKLSQGSLEWATPVLYMQSPHGRLFDDLLNPKEAKSQETKSQAKPAEQKAEQKDTEETADENAIRIQQIKELITQYSQNLYDSEIQAAKYGTIDVPTRLRNEIRDTKQTIKRLQEELEQLSPKDDSAAKQKPTASGARTSGKEKPPAHQKAEDEEKKIRLDVFYQEGMKYYDEGNWKEAVVLLQTVCELNPTHPGAASMLKSAKTKLQEQETQRRQQSRLEILFIRAKTLFDDEQWREALDLLQVIQADDPTFRTDKIKEMIEEAEAKHQRALAKERDQLRWKTLYQRAKEAIEQENWTRAIYVLETLKQQSVGYEDVSELLDEARRRQMLNDEYQLGKRAFEDKKWDDAVVHFGRVHAWDKTYEKVEQKLSQAQQEQNLAARYQEGLDFLKAERWQEAIEAFEPIADEDLLRPETRLARRYAKARLNMEREAWAKAIEILRSLAVAGYRDAGDLLKIAQQEEKWAAAFKKGQKLLQNKKWAEAAAAFQTIVNDAPDYKQGQAKSLLDLAQEEAKLERYYQDAQRQLKLEQWAEAIPPLEKIQKIRPTYKDTRALLTKARQEKKWAEWYAQAIALTNAEKWAKAIETFQRLLKDFPGYKDAAERLENARLQQKLREIYHQAEQAIAVKEWRQAAQLLEQIVKQQADFPDAVDKLNIARRQAELTELYEQGQTHYRHQQWAEAIVAFEKLKEKLEPNNPLDATYKDAALLLTKARQAKSLADDYQRAQKAAEAQEYDEAIQSLEKIIAKDPNYKGGEASDTLTRIKKSQELARNYKIARRYIAQEQWDKATHLLENILSIHPYYRDTKALLEQANNERHNFTLYMKAVRYVNKPDLPAAIAAFEELLARAPGYKDAPQKLAAARRQQGLLADYQNAERAINQRDWDQAVILLERVVEAQDNFMDAKAKLSIARRQASLKLLYEEGKEHFQAKRWEKAVMALEELLPKLKQGEPLDKAYMNTSDLLEQARQGKYLAETYKQAREALKIEDWAEAVTALKKITTKRAGYKEADALLKQATREYNFKQAYQKGEIAYNNSDWAAAIQRFTGARKHKPDHRETQDLLEEAKRQQAIEEALQEGADYEEKEEWAKAVAAYRRIIEKIAPTHAEAISRFNRAERQLNLTTFMAQAEEAIGQEDWDPAIEALSKVVAIDNAYHGAGEKLVNAKEQRRRAEIYRQARAALEAGQNASNRENLQSAITLFDQLPPDYKGAAQHLQAAREELHLLDDYILAERLFKAEDWTGAKEKFEQIANRRSDYRDTQARLKDARLNEADREHWYAADELLKRSQPSDEDLLQAKNELEQIIDSGPSAYEKNARAKRDTITKQLNIRLQAYYDEMMARAQDEEWDAALEALEKICNVDAHFKDASNILRDLMQKAVENYEQLEEYEIALKIFDLSEKITEICDS